MKSDNSKGRLILTGASGGIGRAVAERLAREGWRLLLVGRSLQSLQALQRALPGGAQAHALLQADITSADARSALYIEATKLSDLKSAVRSLRWSDDSSRIFFSAEEPQTEAQKEARKNAGDGIFVDEGPNGQGRGNFSNLWVITLAALYAFQEFFA